MPTEDREAVLARILADPNTKKIARKLKIPLKDYAAQVLEFYLHPKQEPQLVYISDENLKRHAGYTPPSFEEMNKWTRDEAAVVTHQERTEYTDSQAKKVEITDTRKPLEAEEDEELSVSVKQHLKSTRRKA